MAFCGVQGLGHYSFEVSGLGFEGVGLSRVRVQGSVFKGLLV